MKMLLIHGVCTCITLCNRFVSLIFVLMIVLLIIVMAYFSSHMHCSVISPMLYI